MNVQIKGFSPNATLDELLRSSVLARETDTSATAVAAALGFDLLQSATYLQHGREFLRVYRDEERHFARDDFDPYWIEKCLRFIQAAAELDVLRKHFELWIERAPCQAFVERGYYGCQLEGISVKLRGLEALMDEELECLFTGGL